MIRSKLVSCLFLLLSIGLVSAGMAQSVSQSTISIIPIPAHLRQTPGLFLLDGRVKVAIQAPGHIKEVTAVARFFTHAVDQLSGEQLQMVQTGQQSLNGKIIYFKLAKTPSVGAEGYQLLVTPEAIHLQANQPRGLFYGIQSLLQTMPKIRTNQLLRIPCMEIKDSPSFRWRGMMLDVSRHFFAPELVKEFIDLLATYKMNTFHWHLVDGAGWRIEIKKYPKLTSQAAWRVDDFDQVWNWSDIKFNRNPDSATYGGYYTQDQIRDIVTYAAKRYITIVPEIEMPGHSEAAMAAYPEFSCLPHKSSFKQSGNFYAHTTQSNYCPGNDSAFIFIENVLKEVMALFPSKYIHVGGDEVDKTSWKNCPLCQARMKKEGLKTEEELQSYFMQRIERFLNANGRKMIGWDEILEGGLAPQATVMSWRGESGGIKAAQMGHDVVMSPGTPLYFDHYQGDPASEPRAIGGFNTLKMVYNYKPVPAQLSQAEASHVLGAQANLWTEYIPTYEQVEYMILPRMLALSEVLWSPESVRNWKDFNRRLRPQLVGFAQKGLHYSKGNFKVDIKPENKNGQLMLSLETENENGVIYYTTDGTEPTTGSTCYTAPFLVDHSMRVKAGLAINHSMVKAPAATRTFTFNKATGKSVKYVHLNSKYYPANGLATLTDGMRGTTEIGHQWHAFSGQDMIAQIDFGQTTTAGYMALGCLQQYDQWIFYPKWVKFEVSMDGKNFKVVATIDNTVPTTDRAGQFKDFSAKFSTQSFRYLRVTAKNLGECPAGHPGAGKPGSAWLFCDEIIVQ